MTKAWTLVAVGMVFPCSWIGCDGSESGPAQAAGGAAGHSASCDSISNRPVNSLTAAEFGQLCDCSANLQGGYGSVTHCDGGITVMAPKDQQECLTMAHPTQCAMPVVEVLACSADLDACKLHSDICTKYIQCFSEDGGS